MNLSITNAEYLGNYNIKLKFSDGEIRAVDFGQFLFLGSKGRCGGGDELGDELTCC